MSNCRTTEFTGLSPLARHRVIMARVGDLIPYPVHALSIRALAPSEFSSKTKGSIT